MYARNHCCSKCCLQTNRRLRTRHCYSSPYLNNCPRQKCSASTKLRSQSYKTGTRGWHQRWRTLLSCSYRRIAIWQRWSRFWTTWHRSLSCSRGSCYMQVRLRTDLWHCSLHSSTRSSWLHWRSPSCLHSRKGQWTVPRKVPRKERRCWLR